MKIAILIVALYCSILSANWVSELVPNKKWYGAVITASNCAMFALGGIYMILIKGRCHCK